MVVVVGGRCWLFNLWGGGGGGGEGAVKKGSIPPGTGLSSGGGGGPLQWAKYESTISHKVPSGLMQRKLS